MVPSGASLTCLWPLVPCKCKPNRHPIIQRVSLSHPTALARRQLQQAEQSWLVPVTSTDSSNPFRNGSTKLSPSSRREPQVSSLFDSFIVHVLPSISHIQDLLRPSSTIQPQHQGQTSLPLSRNGIRYLIGRLKYPDVLDPRAVYLQSLILSLPNFKHSTTALHGACPSFPELLVSGLAIVALQRRAVVHIELDYKGKNA